MIDIRKNSVEVVRVQNTNFKGFDLVDIRIFYQDGESLKPTKKGITIKRELIDDLIQALQKLKEEQSHDS